MVFLVWNPNHITLKAYSKFKHCATVQCKLSVKCMESSAIRWSRIMFTISSVMMRWTRMKFMVLCRFLFKRVFVRHHQLLSFKITSFSWRKCGQAKGSARINNLQFNIKCWKGQQKLDGFLIKILNGFDLWSYFMRLPLQILNFIQKRKPNMFMKYVIAASLHNTSMSVNQKCNSFFFSFFRIALPFDVVHTYTSAHCTR